MAGRGPAPKDPLERRRENAPARGEWTNAPGIGWQHGKIPPSPAGLMPSSRKAWRSWMRSSWVASFWTPEDLPALHQLIQLFDLIERGVTPASARGELRIQMDTFGLTPKGRQDRRWLPPLEEAEAPGRASRSGRYDHLRVVSE